jgi:hypothetical protein
MINLHINSRSCLQGITSISYQTYIYTPVSIKQFLVFSQLIIAFLKLTAYDSFSTFSLQCSEYCNAFMKP